MSRPPWAGRKRDASEVPIVQALQRIGALVYRCDGVPWDIVVQFRGLIYLAELKTGNAPLEPSQQDAMAKGWIIRVWRKPEDAVVCVTGSPNPTAARLRSLGKPQ